MVGGLGGVRPPVGSTPAGASGLPSFLSSPEMSQVLSGLDIKMGNIITAKQEKGLQLTPSFNEVHVIELTQDQQQVIQTILGNTVGIQAALLSASEDEIKLIRTRMGEIEGSFVKEEAMAELLELLGLQAEGEVVAFQDSQGGLVLIQSGLKELEESIED